MEENDNKLLARLEALLFYFGEPVEIKRAAKFLGVSAADTERAAQKLQVRLNDPSSGLMLITDTNKIQLVTKPEFKDLGEELIRDEFRDTLTPAALETLSLIAYLGPIPRSTIDYVRGVNSSFILRSLYMRGLIDRSQKGNSYYYEASFDFLKHMGLSRKEDLPEFEKYRDVLKKFKIT